MDALQVITPGPFTTVQDAGRFGYQQVGVPVSGALDTFAFHVANLLVGNPMDAAVLEITILGPRFVAWTEFSVALCGAEMDFFINDTPVPRWETIRIRKGDAIAIGPTKKGCRGYLSFTGGIDVPSVMGSRSTYVGGALGGYDGRCLQSGDVIRIGPGRSDNRHRRLPEGFMPDYPSEIALRLIPGPQDDFFDQAFDVLLHAAFMVTPKADRMGYRLQGPTIRIKEDMPQSIISEPTMPGGIQIPADRQPIILLVEQTVGGYAKIATVITPDLFKVAQATPGDTFRFEPVSLKSAHDIYKESVGKMRDIAECLSSQ